MTSGYRINLAATRNDWINLFRSVEGNEVLHFYRSVAHTSAEIIPYRLEDLPRLGAAKFGLLVQEDYFLAIPFTNDVRPRKIEQRDGNIRYAIDQQENSDSFVFRPGGLWNEYFVIREISSLYGSGFCAEVARKMKTQIRRTAYQNKTIYRVGPECQQVYSNLTFTTDYRNTRL